MTWKDDPEGRPSKAGVNLVTEVGLVGVSQIMTNLDLEMIGPCKVRACDTADGDLPLRDGAEVSAELHGRKLLHFVLDQNLGAYRHGTRREIFTTPTPYPADDVVAFLALPSAHLLRRHVLILDPMMLHDIRGPRQVRWGHGIEYILARGFGEDAIDSRWEMEL